MIRKVLGTSGTARTRLAAAPPITCACASTREVLGDLLSVCAILNESPQARLDPYDFQEILISVCYRLLCVFQLGDALLQQAQRDDDRAIQTGLLSLVTTILFQYGNSRRISYRLLAGNLRHAIQNQLDTKTSAYICVWMCFVGGVSVLDNEDDRHWLTSTLRGLIRELDVTSWTGVQRIILLFPWIRAIHDKPALVLWTSLDEGISSNDHYAPRKPLMNT